MSADDEAPQMRLLMPFVVVTSKGGPYDDASFTAGWEMGKLDRDLSALPRQHQITIRTLNVPQADLIGMRYGYRCEAETSTEVPEWTFVTFSLMKPLEATDAH